MRIVFMGTPEFALPSLDMLVNEGYDIVAVTTQPDRPSGRGRKLCCPPTKEYANKKCIDVLQPEKVRNLEFINEIKSLNPDLLITAAYGRILPKEVLNIPKFGCINVHASLLPKYRGAAPINWAIINGETKTGITTMQTDVGMDTGDILMKNGITITDEITAGQLEKELALLGASTLKETLIKLKDGTLKKVPQNHDEASYSPMMDKKVGLIDWDKSSKAIHDLVRGTNPWPVAHTFYKGKRIKVWSTEYEPKEIGCQDNTKPGTICSIAKDGILVKCRDSFIKILELQFDGCRRLCVDDCWHNFEENEVFGENKKAN